MTNDLTAREREILAFVESGLTNNQIAERLGISGDGVKYHVSQAMAKLDAKSRYEAAAMARSRRPVWVSVPVIARLILGTATACVIALLALLASGVLRSGDGDGDAVTGITTSQVLDRIEQAATRDGQILHSVAHVDGGIGGVFSMDYWADPETGAVLQRYTPIEVDSSDGIPTVNTTLYTGRYKYTDEGNRQSAEPCPGITPDWLSFYLNCDQAEYRDTVSTDITVEQREWRGTSAMVLVLTQRFESPSESPAPPAGTPQVSILVSRLYLDPDSFLPLGSTNDVTLEGLTRPFGGEATYTHEFVPRTDDLVRTLDPVALGYEPDLTQLPALDARLSLYWLGETWTAANPDNSLELSNIETFPFGSADTRLSYTGRNSLVPGIVIDHWRPDMWADAAQGDMRQLLDDRDCVTRSPRDLAGREFALYEMAPVQYPLPSPGTNTQTNCWWRAINSGSPLAEYGFVLVWESDDVVLQVSTTTTLGDVNELLAIVPDLREY